MTRPCHVVARALSRVPGERLRGRAAGAFVWAWGSMDMQNSNTRTTGATRRTSRLALFGVAAALVLMLSACGDWATFHHDNTHAGFTLFGPDNDGQLTTSFTATTGGPVFSSAAVMNGVVYVGSLDSKLYAFDAGGTTNCGGSPVSCNPLWTGVTPSGFSISSSPTVANGIVYIGSDDNFVYAFDANGETNCSGTPKTCAPLWADHTSSTVRSSPTVENGVLYIGSSHDTLEAFDANGVTNCSGTPKTCTPLWSGTAPGIIGAQDSVPAVANGLVYVGSRDGNLYAFDAAGNTNCAGAPKVCAPIWRGPTSPGANMQSSPAVIGGIVYVGGGDGKLYTFDAAGIGNCTAGITRVCAPLWTGPIGFGVSSSPALSNGLVYVGGGDGKLYAFDAAGVAGCSGVPKVCAPRWASQASTQIFLSSPAVANGVVYIGSFHDVHAFDATTGAPLSHFTTGGFIQASPAVANGRVYIGSGDGNLYALS